jgi:hypothetical protein
MKRTNIYRAANVSFNPTTLEAYSYAWWKFVGVVEGQLIFNNYRYSNTTSGHQAKVRHLLNELGVKIDLSMPIPRGLPGTYGKYGSTNEASLAELIVQAEEQECDAFLREQERTIIRAERARAKRERETALAAIEAAKPKLTLVAAV